MTKFRPTFVVTVIPAEISCGDTSNGQDYISMADARIEREGQASMQRTVMAYGPVTSTLSEILEPGKPVRVAVRHNGGTLKIVGLPRNEAL